MSVPTPPISAEEIEALPPEIQTIVIRIVDYYERRIAAYERRIAAYGARIAALESELMAWTKKTPRNSSLPPSAEHPHARPQRDKKKKSKKKRGGQQGHKKHERPLIPPDQCKEVVPLRPVECRRCGGKLSGTD